MKNITPEINVINDEQTEIDSIKQRISTLEGNHQELVDNINSLDNKVNTNNNNALANIGNVAGEVETHTSDKFNPHDVTKSQVGLDKVDNTSDLEKPISTAVQGALDNKLNASDYVPCGCDNIFTKHIENKDNPHVVTKEQIGLSDVPNVIPYHEGNKPTKIDIGLGNVDNTSDLSKPISTATQSVLNGKLNTSAYTATDVLSKIKSVDGSGSGLDADLLDGRNAANAANSIPILDSAGKLPIGQIPTGTVAGTIAMGNHGHGYLPLSGGTVTGATNFTGVLNKGGKEVAITEMGKWTPRMISTGKYPSYSTYYNYGTYYKINKLVYISFHMKVEITNAGTGYGRVTGLPFPTLPGWGEFGLAQIEGFGGVSYPKLSAFIYGGEPFISIQGPDGAAAVQWKTGTTWLGFSGCYITS